MNRRLQLLVEAMAKDLGLRVTGVDYSRAYSPNLLLHNFVNELASAQLTRTMLFHYRKLIGFSDDKSKFGLHAQIEIPPATPIPPRIDPQKKQ